MHAHIRRAAAACLILGSALLGVSAAERPWQVGTWTKVDVARQLIDFGPGSSAFGPRNSTPTMRAMANVHTYVIETSDLVIEIKDVVSVSRRSVDAVVGTQVTFAIDKNTVYVRDENGIEHKLRVTKKSPKPTADQTAR